MRSHAHMVITVTVLQLEPESAEWRALVAECASRAAKEGKAPASTPGAAATSSSAHQGGPSGAVTDRAPPPGSAAAPSRQGSESVPASPGGANAGTLRRQAVVADAVSCMGALRHPPHNAYLVTPPHPHSVLRCLTSTPHRILVLANAPLVFAQMSQRPLLIL